MDEHTDVMSTLSRPSLWSIARTTALWVAGAVAGVSIITLALAGVLGYRLTPVLTGSMRPTYGPGDAVVTRPVPVGAVHPGMIVVVTPPGQSAPYAHRVVAVRHAGGEPVISTKGDANPVADAWQTDLAGPRVAEVVGVVPRAGWVLVAVHRAGAVAGLLVLIGTCSTGLGLRLLARTFRTAGPSGHAASPLPH